ncbi:MAG: ATP-binding protein [Fibrobacteria bacterium]|nr:ATP-binding protein [Fibrobacteria bacterium]
MIEEVLHRYNPWWEDKGFEYQELRDRPLMMEVIKKNIAGKSLILLTGLRRVGKTSLLKLLITHLLRQKSIRNKSILYVSLDNYLLSKYSILDIVEVFRKIQKLKSSDKVTLIFDEVTYKENFEIQLKNLYDDGTCKVFASSSSSLEIKDKKAYLTGRSRVIEVLPLNFGEYLDFKGIVINKSDSHLKEAYFEEFLRVGGMPEYVITGEDEHIKDLVDDIIMKDIAAKRNIKDITGLKDYFLLLMERAGKIASLNKMANILGISPDTSKRYFEMFTDTFLIYPIAKMGKTNERILSPKKIYAGDIGLRNYFTGFRDKGAVFENYVYLQIKSQNPQYVYDGKNEIDFMTFDKTLIEVKYHDEMKAKQKSYFENIKAKKKVVIRNVKALEKYLAF